MEKTFQELAAQHQKCSAVRKIVAREKAPLSRFRRLLSQCFYCRTVSTGQVAVDTTRPATLPMNNLDSPVRPCVPITMMSTFLLLAALMIWSCGDPLSSRLLALIFAFLQCCHEPLHRTLGLLLGALFQLHIELGAAKFLFGKVSRCRRNHMNHPELRVVIFSKLDSFLLARVLMLWNNPLRTKSCGCLSRCLLLLIFV